MVLNYLKKKKKHCEKWVCELSKSLGLNSWAHIESHSVFPLALWQEMDGKVIIYYHSTNS